MITLIAKCRMKELIALSGCINSFAHQLSERNYNWKISDPEYFLEVLKKSIVKSWS